MLRVWKEKSHSGERTLYPCNCAHMDTFLKNAEIGQTMDLSGKFLIAMPGMADPRFERSVVYLCAHSDDGALGLIVNKPADDLSFPELLAQLGIKAQPTAGTAHVRVHFGGPVEHGRGFVLHSADYDHARATLNVDDQVGMTATLDILEDIAGGRGPVRLFMALGYAGWGPGQLEDEIGANGWLTCDASSDILFDDDNATKWERALGKLGIDPLMLSAEAGRA